MPTRYQTIILWIMAMVPFWLVLAVILFGSTKMNFIERLFDFAPDNGDGSLEAVALGALGVIVTGTASVSFFGRRQR